MLDQVNGFYAPRAAANERNAVTYGQWVQGLTAGAAILGAVGAIYGAGVFEVWVATIGTVAAAVGAYALSQRYERLAATYRITADRLALRLALWRLVTAENPDTAADHALVVDAEAIMAAENEAWLAEFLSPTAPRAVGGPQPTPAPQP
jgi:hypothetical protein